MIRRPWNKARFQFADGGKVVRFAAKQIDDAHRRAEGGQRVDLDNFEGFDAPNTAVGVG